MGQNTSFENSAGMRVIETETDYRRENGVNEENMNVINRDVLVSVVNVVTEQAVLLQEQAQKAENEKELHDQLMRQSFRLLGVRQNLLGLLPHEEALRP